MQHQSYITCAAVHIAHDREMLTANGTLKGYTSVAAHIDVCRRAAMDVLCKCSVRCAC